GLNSGEVVVGAVGEDLEMAYTAVGHTVGLAQRMEQLAEPGKAYLTEHTGSLAEGYLALTDLGEFQVKGASRPLRVHELTGVGAARGRLDVSRARGFSRFVGRDDELRVLERAREPGVTVFEDLHWLDPASEAFVANHVEASQGTLGLTILNFRPEYQAPWMSKSYYRQIALAPLGPEAIEEMLRDLLGSDPSLDGLPDVVRERTAGNPFFIEEVVQSFVEAGTLEGERGAYRLVRPVEQAAVPASV